MIQNQIDTFFKLNRLLTFISYNRFWKLASWPYFFASVAR